MLIKQRFRKLLIKDRISDILEEMLLINPEAEVILLIAARHAAWEKAYHTLTMDWEILNQEKGKIRAATLFLIKNFDEYVPTENGSPKTTEGQKVLKKINK